jgi:hypothetical protein
MPFELYKRVRVLTDVPVPPALASAPGTNAPTGGYVVPAGAVGTVVVTAPDAPVIGVEIDGGSGYPHDVVDIPVEALEPVG